VKRPLRAVCILALAAYACGGRKAPEPEGGSGHTHHDETHDHASHGDHDHDPHAAAILHVDPEMIRDLRVTTAPVESRAGGEGFAALGELAVDESAYAEVGSPVPARIVRALISMGDSVRAGERLVELQSQDLGNARADHRTARARLDAARKQLERKRGLHAERIVSLREVQELEADVAALAASEEAAKGALLAMGLGEEDLLQEGGSRFFLRSPIPGAVIERAAVSGAITDPARPLFRIGDLSTLWLVVHAFERDAVRVRNEVQARVVFSAMPGQTFSGRVLQVGRQVDPGTRTVAVRIAIANPSGILRPGMSGTAWLPVGDAGARVTAVPLAALQRLENEWVAFVPSSEEGAFEKRVVGRGRDLGGEIEILSGLKPGERVVVEGAFLLKAEAEKARGQGEHHDH
jgi:cobalt-zinc-cadmium efflux system membrane fusion protein